MSRQHWPVEVVPMQHLIDGYRRFRAERWPERREVFEHLASGGQSPRTMVIACSDSRVDPTMIFNAEPGELFILRNVANLLTFPWLAERVAAKQLILTGTIFDIRSGILAMLQPDGTFADVDAQAPS